MFLVHAVMFINVKCLVEIFLLSCAHVRLAIVWSYLDVVFFDALDDSRLLTI